jgi:hypothetical protein
MRSETLARLLQLARRAPPRDSLDAPPFFAHRVAAHWLSRQPGHERSPWEIFALRGVALSAAAMVLAIAVSASLLPGNSDEAELDYSAEVFSLP